MSSKLANALIVNHLSFITLFGGRPLDPWGSPSPLYSPCSSTCNSRCNSAGNSSRSSYCTSPMSSPRPSTRNSRCTCACLGYCSRARNSTRPRPRNSHRASPCPSTCNSASSRPRNSVRSGLRSGSRNSRRSCLCNGIQPCARSLFPAPRRAATKLPEGRVSVACVTWARFTAIGPTRFAGTVHPSRYSQPALQPPIHSHIGPSGQLVRSVVELRADGRARGSARP